VQDPHETANITLQPVKRYGVDAAILYSDILVVVQALGVKVTMPGGIGIQVPDPVRQPQDLERLQLPTDSASAAELVKDKLPHVIEAVRLIVSRLGQEHGDTPLIGFSGAPWTLFYYMVGGNSSSNRKAGTDFLDTYPAESERILDALQLVVIEYLSAQADAGCKILQMFDAWCAEDNIDPDRFRTLVLPRLAAIKNELKRRHPGVPFMVYARGASYALEDLKESGIDDVLTLDDTVTRAGIRDKLPGVCLQGHFDPQLFISKGKMQDEKTMIRRETNHMLDEIGSKQLIANIKEGFGGKEDPELVDVFVKTVQEYKHKGD
jgi:uroporphyrinogen decarboxylase